MSDPKQCNLERIDKELIKKMICEIALKPDASPNDLYQYASAAIEAFTRVNAA
jgi:hypothetical protein